MDKEPKIKQVGTMEFWLRDDRDTIHNDSVSCSFDLYGTGDEIEEIMPIEKYWCLCRYFAAAMGYCEKTIEDWFGSY